MCDASYNLRNGCTRRRSRPRHRARCRSRRRARRSAHVEQRSPHMEHLVDTVNHLEHAVDHACDEIERLRNQRDALVGALKIAVGMIRAWHSVGLPDATEDAAWTLYQQSPEMRAINAALNALEGEVTHG